jgi:hypothetical protein
MRIWILLFAFLLMVSLYPLIPSASPEWNESETKLVVVVTGLPEDEVVKIYINGSVNGTASLASPLVRTLSRGSVITLTADIYVEGAWGYRYDLDGVRWDSSPPQTQPSITLDSDLVIVICEYSSHNILLSPLLVPLYALLILVGIWSIVRWLSGIVQTPQREGDDRK